MLNAYEKWEWQRFASGALLAALVVVVLNGQPASAAGMLIADGGLGGELTVEEQRVHVTINNGIAVTQVDQVFRNNEDRQVEALYTFPVPHEASVANFSMWINGKEMLGEVLEKKRAREIYDSYKQVRRDPGLLEQTDYKTFEMRIFPIGPRAQQHVQIAYYQELDADDDWATYVYPLAARRTRGAGSATAGKFGLTLEVKSEVPILAMESPSHAKELAVAKHTDTFYQASLEAAGADLNKDVVIAYHLSRPHTGIDVITSKNAGEDGYFYLTLTAGPELAAAKPGMDYVFILDVSGSMANDGKLQLSRESIGAFVKSLGAEDRFEIIAFNVQPARLFDKLSAVSDESKTAAMKFLDSQQARGGTMLRPAMKVAYKYADPDRPLNAVVLSDGMTEQSERQELFQLIRERPTNAHVFCIGVGNDVNQPLLKQIAADSGGLAAFVSQGDDFERQAQAFRRKLTRPAASNLKIECAGTQVYDLEPKELPNLYHGMPVRLYGRYKNAGAVSVNVQADIAGTPLKNTVQIELPDQAAQNPEIERMWAWHRMQRLLGVVEAGGPKDDAVAEVIRLGESYSIVSEYTSFIVLENDAEYKRWKIERKNALRTKTDRNSQEKLRGQFDQIRNKALSDLGPSPEIKPVAANPAQNPNTISSPLAQGPASNNPGRNVDLFPGQSSRGGGAIDPVLAIIGLTLAAAAVDVGRKTCRPIKKNKGSL